MCPTRSSISPFADFGERLCARFHVPPDRYLEIAFRCTLYPQARLLRPLLLWLDADFFAADRDFLASVGRLWRRREFKVEVWDFLDHPANRGCLRRGLRLRVSVERTRRLVDALLENPPPDGVVFLRAPEVDAPPIDPPPPPA
jgi:hypothetical protein